MGLEVVKTTKLVGNLMVGNEIVKQITVDINQHGVSNVYESIYNQQLYMQNRREMRKQEAEFREKRYAVEDEILAAIEADSVVSAEEQA